MDVDAALVAAFAEAVAEQPKCRFLRAEGGRKVRGGYASIREAASEGRPFMVGLRDGLVALDVDPADGNVLPDGVLAAARTVGCEIVRVGSGRAGHEHVYINGPVGWTTADLRQMVKDAGVGQQMIRWGGRDIRPPLSRHPDGGRGNLIEPTDRSDALRRLQTKPRQTGFNREKWDHVLATGVAPGGRYAGNRSAAAAGFAVAAVNAGWRRREFEAAVRLSSALSPKLTAMGEANAETWLSTTWANACRKVRDSPPTSQNQGAVEAITRTALTYPWRGVAGETDRRVYSWLAGLASEVRGTRVGCDQRRIAERVGVTRKTVGKSLQRLRATGFLVLVEGGSGTQASTYELLPKVGVRYSNTSLAPLYRSIGVSNTDFDDCLPDAFRGQCGLPRAAYDTWQALPADQWTTVAGVSLARPGSLSSETVRKHLRALLSAGLVERNSARGQRWRRLPADQATLVSLAAYLGSAGATEFQREQHERERDTYRQWGSRSVA